MDVYDIVRGDLSDGARVWTALAPAVLLVAWFIGGLAIYAVRIRLRGRWRDHEFEARPHTAILGRDLRLYFSWVTRPAWLVVRATGLPADALTTLSMLVALASGVAMAGGRFALGGWLYILSGILDVFDGRLARETGTQSPAGAALDSILDRYADAAVLAGLAWFYRDTWVLAVVLVALAGSFLTSYIRAKGESLGLDIRGGLMQRAERIFCLGVTTALAPVVAVVFEPGVERPMHWLAVGGLLILAVSSQWTAGQRFAAVLRGLGRTRPPLLSAGRDGLLRGLVASGVATAVDFACVLLLVDRVDLSPWAATALGCLVGAVINFALGRIWAFGDRSGALLPQAGRYAFVSLSSLGLNAAGVALCGLLPVDYRVAWFVVRGAVFGLWNFPLQRDYVFGRGPLGAPAVGAIDAAAPEAPASPGAMLGSGAP